MPRLGITTTKPREAGALAGQPLQGPNGFYSGRRDLYGPDAPQFNVAGIPEGYGANLHERWI